MSVIDSLIKGLGYNTSNNDDDDYDSSLDEDDGYDQDEEEEDDRPKSRFHFGRQKNNDRQDEPEEEYVEQRPAPRSLTGGSRVPAPRPASPAPVRRQGPSGGSNMQVRIIKPSSFDQTKEITDTLLDHRTVLLNLEGLDVNTAQRIVDFASGSCYALRGNFMKISHFIIVITPEDVAITGDADENGNILGAIGGAAGLGSSASYQSNDAVQGNGAAPSYGAQPNYGQQSYNTQQYGNYNAGSYRSNGYMSNQYSNV